MLFHQHGGYGFEGYAEIDVLPVADASLYAARVVGMSGDASGVVVEHIVLFRTFHFQPFKTVAVLEGLGGVDAQHARCQGSLQLAEHRLSQSHGASCDDTGDDAAYRVALGFYFGYELFHFFGLLRVGAADGICFGQLQVIRRIVFF